MMRKHLRRYEISATKYAFLILAGWVYLFLLSGVEGKMFPVAKKMDLIVSLPSSTHTRINPAIIAAHTMVSDLSYLPITWSLLFESGPSPLHFTE